MRAHSSLPGRAGAADPMSNKTSVLIVEDEGLIAVDLKKKLEQAGYAVPIVVDNADDALRNVELLRPSLVLMDIGLRGPRDGVETADQIRRRFHIPVVFVTGHSDLETLERARITEPFGYIVKPFHGVDFRAQIEIALWKHKMEEKVRTSEAWLSTIFRNVADALIATDSKGNITLMNAPAEELTGCAAGESKDKPLLDVLRILDAATDVRVVEPLDAIREGRETATCPQTFKLIRRGGSDPVLVEAELSANRDGGRLLGIIVVFRDVTERREAERRNLQLQKMNSLALMAIGLGREMAESQNRMDESLNQLIARSQGSTLRLLGDVYDCSARQQSVVQQLLTLGKMSAGQAVVLDMNEIVTGLAIKFRKALGSRRSLKMNLEPGILPIKADPQELRASLFRLVLDARDAMPDGGVVEVSSMTMKRADGTRAIQLAIRDTGKGIRPSAADRIFDPYYQSRPGNRNPGFSLALVYQFVALSGGSIDVQSAPTGAAYLVNFPAADRDQLPAKIDDQRRPVFA
jgi:two-component system, cell cycle sensor histidine kinase and response regulator CckA